MVRLVTLRAEQLCFWFIDLQTVLTERLRLSVAPSNKRAIMCGGICDTISHVV